jgi:UbiD family decarboxylase
LREWMKAVESHGELLRLSGVSPDLEMAGIMEVLDRQGKRPLPAILFDEVSGHQKGYRALFGMLASPWRIATSLGLPEDNLNRTSLVRNLRNKRRNLKLIPPEIVTYGPVQENTFTDKSIDLLKFPTPRHHELDGGRYFGTACVVILKHPDEGWVNLGTYRCMLVDKNRLALHISPHSQGKIIFDEYVAREQAVPVAVALGVDPALWFTSFDKVQWGVSEYDFAGGIRGEPIKVIEAPYTGLPVPASAEIVVEGECRLGDMVGEGPFGEWHGYYANLGLEPVPEPVVTVKTVMHRNNSIMSCVQVGGLRTEFRLAACVSSSVALWDALEGSHVPGIAGVWCHEAGGGSLLNVISLKTLYAGHSRQAALIGSEVMLAVGHYTIVVDEDVDPSDLEEVMWVVASRTDPQRAIDIQHYCPSSNIDPAISIEQKKNQKHLFTSHAVIDACRPYEWKNEFYPIARISPELREKILKKWKRTLKEYL